MTWENAIDGYLSWLAASGASPATLRLRRHYLSRLSRYSPDPWQVDPAALVRFLAKPGWAPETRKSARSSVRGFYGWAVDAELLVRDPSRTLPRVRIPQAHPRPTPKLIVAQALRDADERGRLMIHLALLAGLRRAEIARTHTADIIPDLLGSSLRVVGKGGRVRVVPLHPTLDAELSLCPPGWVFPGQIDGHLSPDRVGHLLAEMLGTGWTGHTLRHAFASAAYAVERDLRAVQTLLGHTRPETTARYVALPDNALRAAVNGTPLTAPV